MEAPNPYESPHEVNETKKDERFVRRYLPLLTGGLASGLLLSAFYPFIGVPLTLVATPAMVRATRIYWRTVRASQYPDWTDWCGFFFASLAAVLPLSFLGGIAFCCVCSASGYVIVSVANPNMHSESAVYKLLYGPMYLGLAAGLLASLFLLKRLNYLSRVEKAGLAEHATSHDRSALTGESRSDERLQQGGAKPQEDEQEFDRGADGGGSG